MDFGHISFKKSYFQPVIYYANGSSIYRETLFSNEPPEEIISRPPGFAIQDLHINFELREMVWHERKGEVFDGIYRVMAASLDDYEPFKITPDGNVDVSIAPTNQFGNSYGVVRLSGDHDSSIIFYGFDKSLRYQFSITELLKNTDTGVNSHTLGPVRFDSNSFAIKSGNTQAGGLGAGSEGIIISAIFTPIASKSTIDRLSTTGTPDFALKKDKDEIIYQTLEDDLKQADYNAGNITTITEDSPIYDPRWFANEGNLIFGILSGEVGFGILDISSGQIIKKLHTEKAGDFQIKV